MKIPKRRRQEGKTDYLKRLKMLKGGAPRLIFRRSNRYILAQYAVSKEAKDKILLGVNSKELTKYGWPKNSEGSLKSLPASYLTGLLVGKKIIKAKLENPIVDLGMYRILYKSKIFAFIRGLIDAGIRVKADEKFFPDEKRIKGEHLKNKIPFNEIKQKIEKI